MAYFEHGGLQFQYLDRGEGVPVFFQHGLGGDTERILQLLELPQGFRLLGLDCRGHGKTTPLGEPERLRFAVFADDLVALMDKLGLPQAVVGGTSLGAGVALNCALRFPRRVMALVLLRPAWLDAPNPTNAKLFGLIAQYLRELGPEAGLEAFLNTAAYAAVARESADVAGSLVALFRDARAVETVARLERLPQDAPNWDRAEWRCVKAPTLVLSTRRDPIHPFEFGQVLAREIPGAQFRELTAKAESVERYTAELRKELASFLAALRLGKGETPNDREETQGA
jgi:pimeloyl-ACP methyl ester carboxylesterase